MFLSVWFCEVLVIFVIFVLTNRPFRVSFIFSRPLVFIGELEFFLVGCLEVWGSLEPGVL